MSIKLPAGSTVLGYAQLDLIFIADCLDMLHSTYSAFDNDEVLQHHYKAIVNRLYELADLPESDNGELYTVLVEPVS